MRIASFVLALTFSYAALATDIKNADEINVFLAPFKTYNGKSLTSLLHRYGLEVQYININSMKMYKNSRHEGDKDDDLVVAIMITGNPKPMPCNLRKWMESVSFENLAEITTRKGKFLIPTHNLDPVLYWASTGKCSPDY